MDSDSFSCRRRLGISIRNLTENSKNFITLGSAGAEDLTTERRTSSSFVSKFTSDQFQGKQLAHTQTGTHIEQHQRSLAHIKGREKRLDFRSREYARCLHAFRALAHPADGIAVIEVVPNGVVEEHAHDVADLGTASGRQRE